MKKILLTVAAAVIAGSAAIGQSAVPPHRTCSSHDHMLAQEAADPALRQRHQEIEAFTAQYVQQQQTANKGTQVIYNIPVVVHVLYNTSTANISDAQILSQIAILNKDYQLLNTDNTSVPSAFASLKADCQINFCMAQRTPAGVATTGIIRKSTTKSTFSTSTDDAKYSSTGGDDAWDRNQYLNIWIVPGIDGGDILGYAQFPGGTAATDGVVIAHNFFGNTGTATAPYNKGRTATHEVGHWLNLRHIWGDDGAACTGSDLVGDTPNQADENYGCPTFPSVSCSNGANGDLFMNYMDYTDDACMYMFTTGQKTRMHAVLASGGTRSTLNSSLGCTAPATTTCNAPASQSAGSVTSSGAAITWGAVSGAASYTLQYKTSAATTWTTASSAIAGTSYSLTGLAASTTYNYRVATNCSGSTSAYTTASSFTTTATTTTCNAPASQSAGSVTSSGAAVTWSAVSGASSYTLQYKTSAATTWSTASTTIAGTSYNFSGLAASTTYNYRVATNCSGSTSAYTTASSFTTTAAATCAVPGSLTTSAITSTTATLGWSAVTGATGYTLQIKLTSATTWSTLGSVTTTSAGASGLTANTSYQWRILTNCSGGATSAYSSAVTFATSAASTCANNYESNNTTATATTMAANTSLQSMIGTTTDNDYFKIVTTAAAPKLKLTLTNLPADYDLVLYNSAGTQLAISENASTTSETIAYNSATVAATYYARVLGYNSVYSTSACYTLTNQIAASNFREAMGIAAEGKSPLTFYPNPTRGDVSFDYFAMDAGTARIQVVDQSGRVVSSVSVALTEGANTAKFSIGQLPAGLYFVRFQAGNNVRTAKLMLEK